MRAPALGLSRRAGLIFVLSLAATVVFVGGARASVLAPANGPTLSAGWFHTCILKPDGSPVCWGRSTEGQTTPPAGLPALKAIAAGGGHTCGIKQTDSKPVCWGLNNFGQLVVPNVPVKQLTAGGSHTCAVKNDNTLICWGSNVGFAGIPAGQSMPPSGTYKQLTTSENHNCAVRISNNTVACWGDDYFGQSTVPGDLGAVSAVSAGAYHTCAIKASDSHVTCWGDNSTQGNDVPASLGAATSVATGEVHACAIKASNGATVCWGANSWGQSDTPAGLGAYSQLSVGFFHNCVVQTAGTVFCWGANDYGQSGGSPVITSASPSTVRGAGTFTHTFKAAPLWLPVRFVLSAGSLPPGLSLDQATGVLGGTPTKDGTYTATVSATNDVFAAGSQSFTITIDRVAPDAPQPLGVKPAALSNTLTPRLVGAAEAGSTVTVFTDPSCSGAPAGSGSSAAFSASGVPATALADTTTTFYARATDAAGNISSCSAAGVAFVNDSTPPPAPVISKIDPVSPSATLTPRVFGAAADETTVDIHAGSDCTGPSLGSGTAEQFAQAGLLAQVPAGVVSQLRATATDVAGNVSDCSGPATYEHLLPVDPTGPTAVVKPLGRPVEGLTARACVRARAGLYFKTSADGRFKIAVARQTSPKAVVPNRCPRVARPVGKARFRSVRTRTTASLKAGAQRLDLEKLVRGLPPGLYRITVAAAAKRAAGANGAEIFTWKLR